MDNEPAKEEKRQGISRNMDNEPAKEEKTQGIARNDEGQFKESGNPDGPKPGYKKLRTRLLEEKMQIAGYDPFDALIAVAIDAEVPLDIRVRVHMDLMGFVYPKLKPQNKPIDIPLGNPKTLPELAEAQSIIVRHLSEGKISSDNGKALSDIIEVQRKAIETDNLEQRLIALENQTKGKGKRF